VLVLLLHLGFVLFAVLGGLAVLRWPRLAWLHLPVVAWAVAVEFAGWICPLTPLENALRQKAGSATYEGGFIDHHVTAALYPGALTRGGQVFLGASVLVLNLVLYAVLWRRHRAAAGAARA
jgi:hypothetical protein